MRRDYRVSIEMDVIRGAGDDYRVVPVVVDVDVESDGADIYAASSLYGVTQDGERIRLTNNECDRAADMAAEEMRK